MTAHLPDSVVAQAAECLAWPTPDPDSTSDAVNLGLRPVGVVAAEVDAAPPRRWLYRRVWPSDAYGVIGAKHKAGKSWVMLEAAVATASGSPWLGCFEADTTGTVLLFAGEGGAAKLTRRGRAVASARGQRWDDLPILVAERVPHLDDPQHLLALRQAVATHQPVLIIVDPLYLAVGANGDGRNLYAMGGVLENAQLIAQQYGAALMVAHHNNRNGAATGSDRLSGAGPAEWGRVLVTLDAKFHKADPESGRTDTSLEVSVDGDEVPGGTHRFQRMIAAEDQDDLTSPMVYELTVDDTSTKPEKLPGYSPAENRVFAVVDASDDYLGVHNIMDRVKTDPTRVPLKKRTVQDALSKLAKQGLIDAMPRDPGHAGGWRRLGGSEHTDG